MELYANELNYIYIYHIMYIMLRTRVYEYTRTKWDMYKYCK